MTAENLISKSINLPDQSGKSSMVAEYESALCHFFASPCAIAVNSGSAAITATLMALGATSASTVIVSAAAPLPTLMPILATGAAIRFADCRPHSPQVCHDSCRRLIDKSVVAVVEVPLWGYPSDYEPLLSMLHEYDIPLLEDSSHAHGSHINGKFVGTFGRAGCFSTHHKKLLSTGEGGFVITHDEELAARVRRVCRLGNLDGSTFGYNFKMPAITAALGISRLESLREIIASRRANRSRLIELLDGPRFKEVHHIGAPNGYNLVLWTDEDQIHAKLASSGIFTDPVRYRYQLGYRHAITEQSNTTCPNAEKLISHLVQLPTDTPPEAVAEAVMRATSVP